MNKHDLQDELESNEMEIDELQSKFGELKAELEEVEDDLQYLIARKIKINLILDELKKDPDFKPETAYNPQQEKTLKEMGLEHLIEKQRKIAEGYKL